jgi:dihydrofolate reductase
LAANLVDQLDITQVHHSFDADVYFPEIKLDVWKEVSRENFENDESNSYKYSFISYKKRT